MAVTLKKLTQDELPDEFRARQLDVVFKVTAEDGQVVYLESEEEAAALVTKLHREDQDRHSEE